MAKLVSKQDPRIIRAELQGPATMWQPGGPFVRPSMRDLLGRYGHWVYRCVSLNAQTAAAVPFKLLAPDRTGAMRGAVLRGKQIKPISKAMQSYLAGAGTLKPGSRVLRKTHNLKDLVEVPEHPVLDLLDDVNDWTDGFGWRESLYADLNIFGRAFTQILAESGTGRVRELWRLRPELMKVIPSETKFIATFRYGPDDRRVDLPRDEVLWFHLYDPMDSWGGVGPLEAWLRTADASIHIQEFQHWLMQRHGSPDWALLSDEALTEPQKRAFLRSWRERFGRMFRRKENVAFIAGRPRPELKQLNSTPRELEFNQSQLQVRDMIGQAFGVPKSLLTTDDVNRSNGRESDEFYMRTTIWPLVQRVEDVLNERLLSRFGEGLILVHENPVPEDRQIRIEERTSLLQSGSTVNEVREADGMEPVEGGDEPLITAGLTTLDQLLNPPDPLSSFLGGPAPRQEQPRQDDDSVPQNGQRAIALHIIDRHLQGMSRSATISQLCLLAGMEPHQAKALLGKKRQKRLQLRSIGVARGQQPLSHAMMWLGNGHVCKQDEPQENLDEPKRFRERLMALLREQIIKTAGALDEGGIELALATLADEQWVIRMASLLRPGLEKTITAGLREGLARVGPVEVAFDVVNPAVETFIENYTIRLASQIAGTTQLAASRVISRTLEDGGSVKDIAIRLRDLDEAVSGYRAEMIARTETARAFMAGQQESWRQSGVVKGKKWLLAPNACEFCRALDREFKDRVIPLTEPFYQIGHVLTGVDGGRLKLDYTPIQAPPLHPHDRCDLIPVIK